MLLAASWGLKSFTMSTQAFESDEIFRNRPDSFQAISLEVNTFDNKLYLIFEFILIGTTIPNT
jgi:hypothetical protein